MFVDFKYAFAAISLNYVLFCTCVLKIWYIFQITCEYLSLKDEFSIVFILTGICGEHL
jgi:hypothetical protein